MAWIRGAICAENTVKSVKKQTLKLFDEVVRKNNLSCTDIEAVFFTVTKDINVCYPAKFVRAAYTQLSNVAFVCAQEMEVVGSLSKCIRICIGTNSAILQQNVIHCYLDGAEVLRPDLQ